MEAVAEPAKEAHRMHWMMQDKETGLNRLKNALNRFSIRDEREEFSKDDCYEN